MPTVFKPQTKIPKTTVVLDFDQLPVHNDQIDCPKCGHRQMAKVIHALPHFLYQHECTKCFYIIRESEWKSIQ